MAEDLRKLVYNLISNFNLLKKESYGVLNSTQKISKLDLSNKEILSNVSKLSVGFTGDRILKTMKGKGEISDKDLFSVKSQCRAFIFEILKNLLEKSPIRYATVRCLVALDPRHMALSSGDCYSKMKYLLAQLVKSKLVPETMCEDILMEYYTFLLEVVKNKVDKFQSFDPTNENSRLDTFLKDHCDKKEFSKLWKLLKMLLILSHGQADVERGFSFNRKIEVENLKAETLVAQRSIIDHLRYNDLEISKELRTYAVSARQKYVMYLEDQKNVKKSEILNQKRKSDLEHLSNMKCKKIRLETAIHDLESNADHLAEKAENCGSLNFISQSNSFRRSAKEKKCELEKLEKEIENVTKALKD